MSSQSCIIWKITWWTLCASGMWARASLGNMEVKVCTACSTGCCHDLAECLLQQTALHKSCATTCCRLAHQQSLHLSPSQGRSNGEFCDLLQWHWKIFSTEVKVWGPLPDFLHFKSHSPKPIFSSCDWKMRTWMQTYISIKRWMENNCFAPYHNASYFYPFL